MFVQWIKNLKDGSSYVKLIDVHFILLSQHFDGGYSLWLGNAVYPYTLVHFLRFLHHFSILSLAFGLRQWRTRSNFTEVDSKAPGKLSYFSPYRNSNGDNGHQVNSVVLWSGVSSQREVSSWREVSSLTRALAGQM